MDCSGKPSKTILLKAGMTLGSPFNDVAARVYKHDEQNQYPP